MLKYLDVQNMPIMVVGMEFILQVEALEILLSLNLHPSEN